MSDSTWALIEVRNNLKKVIALFVAVLHWKASIKLKTEKLSEALGVTRGVTLRNWLKVLKHLPAFVGDLGEGYKITKELVNANTVADPSTLDLN